MRISSKISLISHQNAEIHNRILNFFYASFVWEKKLFLCFFAGLLYFPNKFCFNEEKSIFISLDMDEFKRKIAIYVFGK